MLGWLFRALFGPARTERLQADKQFAAREVFGPKLDHYREGLAGIDRHDYRNASRQVGNRSPLARLKSQREYAEKTVAETARAEAEQRQATAEAIHGKFMEWNAYEAVPWTRLLVVANDNEHVANDNYRER